MFRRFWHCGFEYQSLSAACCSSRVNFKNQEKLHGRFSILQARPSQHRLVFSQARGKDSSHLASLGLAESGTSHAGNCSSGMQLADSGTDQVRRNGLGDYSWILGFHQKTVRSPTPAANQEWEDTNYTVGAVRVAIIRFGMHHSSPKAKNCNQNAKG